MYIIIENVIFFKEKKKRIRIVGVFRFKITVMHVLSFK